MVQPSTRVLVGDGVRHKPRPERSSEALPKSTSPAQPPRSKREVRTVQPSKHNSLHGKNKGIIGNIYNDSWLYTIDINR